MYGQQQQGMYGQQQGMMGGGRPMMGGGGGMMGGGGRGGGMNPVCRRFLDESPVNKLTRHDLRPTGSHGGRRSDGRYAFRRNDGRFPERRLSRVSFHFVSISSKSRQETDSFPFLQRLQRRKRRR